MLEQKFKKEMGYRAKIQRKIDIPRINVDIFLATSLGWSSVYHGFDGKPWRLVGIIKYKAGTAMRFEHTAGNSYVYSVQILTEKELVKVGQWFLKKGVTTKNKETLASFGIYI